MILIEPYISDYTDVQLLARAFTRLAFARHGSVMVSPKSLTSSPIRAAAATVISTVVRNGSFDGLRSNESVQQHKEQSVAGHSQ